MCLPTPSISQTRFVSADTLVIVPNENNTITIYINWQMGNRQTSRQEEVQRSPLYESLSELFEVNFHWFSTTLLYCSLSFIVFLSILWFSYLFLTPEDHTNIEWMNECLLHKWSIISTFENAAVNINYWPQHEVSENKIKGLWGLFSRAACSGLLFTNEL